MKRGARAAVPALLLLGCSNRTELLPPSGDDFDRPDARPRVDGARACGGLDVLFALQGSSSTREEIAALRADFAPRFLDKLSLLPTLSFRLGVVDGCVATDSLNVTSESGSCTFASGQRWIEGPSPTWLAELQCVLEVPEGCSGGDPGRPAQAAVAALAANPDFLRPDAALLVVAMSDEDEGTDADSVHTAVAAAVAEPGWSFFVGVGGRQNCGETELTATLLDVSERFDETHGFFWDLCAAPPVLADETALGALMWNVTQECTSGLP